MLWCCSGIVFFFCDNGQSMCWCCGSIAGVGQCLVLVACKSVTRGFVETTAAPTELLLVMALFALVSFATNRHSKIPFPIVTSLCVRSCVKESRVDPVGIESEAIFSLLIHQKGFNNCCFSPLRP